MNLFGSYGMEYQCSEICNSTACHKKANFIKQNINFSSDPCTDFSQYSCGNMISTYKNMGSKSPISTLIKMQVETEKKLTQILDQYDTSNSSTAQTKAVKFYRSCMDMISRRNIGLIPLYNYLNVIVKNSTGVTIKDLFIGDFYHNVISFQNHLERTLSTGLTNKFFKIDVDLVTHQGNRFFVKIDQPDFILDPKILKDAFSTEEAQHAVKTYKNFMKNMAKSLFIDLPVIPVLDKIIVLEMQLSQFYEKHSPGLESKSHVNIMLPIKRVQEICPEIDWLSLLNYQLEGNRYRLRENDTVVVKSLKYLKGTCGILKDYLSDKQRKIILHLDLIWGLIDSLAVTLEKSTSFLMTQLKRDLYGFDEIEDNWKSCIDLTSKIFPAPIGNIYIKSFLNDSTLKDVSKLFNNILSALKTEIRYNNWIDNDTKEAVINKISKVGNKIGFDRDFLNQTKIDNLLKSVSINETFFMRNYITFKQFFYKEKMQLVSGIHDSIDTNFIPHEVNAYYDPETHDVYLPAGILQFPIYDSQLPLSLQYGSMGMIIGHELVHGIEATMHEIIESIKKKNKFGHSMLDFTEEQFKKKMKCIMQQYSSYNVQEYPLPSRLTWQEDLADNVGLQAAYKAFRTTKEMNFLLPEIEFDNDQLFFINYAQMWCTYNTKEASLRSLLRDEHSFWRFRINGPLSNMPEFSKAFKCNKNSPMNPENKCLYRKSN